MAKKQLTYRTNSSYVVVAEYRLLNALIYKKDFINDSRIFQEIFIHKIAQSCYKAIIELSKCNIDVTKSSLFQKANEIDFNVTQEIIDKVLNIDNGATVIDDIIEVLNRATKKFNIAKIINELGYQLNSNNDLDEDFTISKLFDATEILNLSGNARMMDIEKWTDDYLIELYERKKGIKHPFGDAHLDKEIIKGAYPGAITLIAGPTGSGKSTYALNLVNGFINLNIPSIYVSLEMGKIDTYDRLAALRHEIPLEFLYQQGTELDPIITKIKDEVETLKKSKLFYFVEDPSLTLDQLHAMIREFKQKTGAKYLIIIVDLLSQVADFMTNVKHNLTVAASTEIAMNKLNAIAKIENVHFIGIVQFNRRHEQRIESEDDVEILRPSLHNVKNSGAYAERSRVVLGLFRKKFYIERFLQHVISAEDMEFIEDILEVQILKNSNGKVGTILNYLFEGDIFKLTSIINPIRKEEENEEI